MTTKEQYNYIVQYLNTNDDCGDGFSLSNKDYFLDIMSYFEKQIDPYRECLWVFLQINEIEHMYYVYSITDVWEEIDKTYIKIKQSQNFIQQIYNILIQLDKESKQYAMMFTKLSPQQKVKEIDRRLKSDRLHL